MYVLAWSGMIKFRRIPGEQLNINAVQDIASTSLCSSFSIRDIEICSSCAPTVKILSMVWLCFSWGWTNIFCLDGTTATLIMSLFVSLFLPRDWHPVVTRNYTSFSLDPTLKWSEMTKHLRRDDDNPSEDLRGSQPSVSRCTLEGGTRNTEARI